VKAAEFDSELFEFDQKREATMRQSMLSVGPAMATLEKALDSGEAKKILDEAAIVGEAMAKVNDFSKRVESSHYRDEVQWE
jgi:hypothetical protein